MAVKEFAFRENWVGSKVASMKTTFFAIFDPTWHSNQLNLEVAAEFLTKNMSYLNLNISTTKNGRTKLKKVLE